MTKQQRLHKVRKTCSNRFSGVKKTRSNQGATLLDLDDALLLEILDHVIDFTDIHSFGAVNKRLNRLHFLARRLESRVKGCRSERRLIQFLKRSQARKGGFLRELRVAFYSWSRRITDQFIYFICRSTLLVKLHIDGFKFSPKHVKRVVASCPMLQSLTVLGLRGGVLNLRSSSLQQLSLGTTGSAALDTPVLIDLHISQAEELSITSHSLRKLVLDMECELQISPPPAALGYLQFGPNFEHGKMKEVLAIIPGGCVDVLSALGWSYERTMDLNHFLKPLTRLRRLELSGGLMEAFARGEVSQHVEALKRLGVEEMVMEVGVHFPCRGKDSMLHSEHITALGSLLRGLLTGSSLRKLVLDSTPLELCCPAYRASWINAPGCRAHLKTLLQGWEDEHPEVTVRYHACTADWPHPHFLRASSH